MIKIYKIRSFRETVLGSIHILETYYRSISYHLYHGKMSGKRGDMGGGVLRRLDSKFLVFS